MSKIIGLAALVGTVVFVATVLNLLADPAADYVAIAATASIFGVAAAALAFVAGFIVDRVTS